MKNLSTRLSQLQDTLYVALTFNQQNQKDDCRQEISSALSQINEIKYLQGDMQKAVALIGTYQTTEEMKQG